MISRQHAVLLLSLAVIVPQLAPTTVLAQEPPRLRIALGADVVRHQEQSAGSGSTEATQASTSGGLLDPRLGIDIGVAIIPQLTVGLLGYALRREMESRVGSTTVTDWSSDYGVMAYGEGTLSLGGAAALYARGLLGVVAQEADPDGDGRMAGWSIVQFTVGAQLGAHLFPAREVSISPYATVRYQTGEFQANGGMGAELSGFEVGLGAQITAWIDLAPRGAGTSSASVYAERAPEPRTAYGSGAATERVESAGSARLAMRGGEWVGTLSVVGALLSEVRATAGEPDLRLVLEMDASDGARFASCSEALVDGEETSIARVQSSVQTTLAGSREVVVVSIPRAAAATTATVALSLQLCETHVQLSREDTYLIRRVATATAPRP